MKEKKNRLERNEAMVLILLLLIVVLLMITKEMDWFNFLRHLLKNLVRNFL